VEDPDSEAGSFGSLRRTEPETTWRVILWGEHRDRLQKISEMIRSVGAQPVVFEELSDLQLVEFSARCCVAVAFMGVMAGGVGIQVVRDLKAKGFKVIACEDGAGFWPIKTKCLPLLAGAVHLLDSSTAEFRDELRRAVERIVRAEAQNRIEEQSIRAIMHGLGMVSESAAMMKVFRAVIRFSALSDLPVLITGETGTGKEGLARAVHSLDPKRSRGPFVAVNCGAISAALVESEFFGHRRGAFTGAERDRKGLIRSAEGGVLFLDEIAELDVPLQTRLLRVLQENRVLGVGEDREVEVSVRVVAASNRDLEQMMQQNKFRADLFYRLNVLSIQVPPLRQRLDDLAPLVEHFLQKYRSLPPTGALSAGADFLEALRQLALPGNVRQLENLVRQALLRNATDSPLSLSDLPAEMLRQLFAPEQNLDAANLPVRKAEMADVSDPGGLQNYAACLLEANNWDLTRSLQNCERHALEVAMRRMHGNQSQTARLLGITPRSVYNKVRKYRLKS
jgi:transcriptional regulator with PAS, ATPase and Fis domain